MQALVDAALKAGFMGAAVWRQGPDYIAAVLDSSGRITDPRCWDLQPTAEAAIADLLARLPARA